MEQPTFADLEYQGKKRKTRREKNTERLALLFGLGNLLIAEDQPRV